MRLGGAATAVFAVCALLLFLGLIVVPGQALAQETWQTEVTVPRGDGDGSNSAVPVTEDPLETGAVQPKVPAQNPSPVIANDAVLTGGPSRTSFKINLSSGVTAEVYTLANPYRVVVDLPDVAFELTPDAGRTGTGLVRAFRYGLFAEGKSRIVLDLTGPVRVEKAEMTMPQGGGRLVLEVVVVPTETASFGEGTGAKRPPAGQAKTGEHESDVPRPRKGTRPVIVIDPGHGGIDPGAVGSTSLLEKNVVLAAGLQLKRALMATGRYDVHMTRTSDVFVSLDRRLKASRTVDADLFISLHADSLEQKGLAQNIRGATVYTLSDRASDEQARQMAEKENASDLLAGIDADPSESGGQVKNILIDLLKRETSNFSTEFSNLLVGRLGKSVALSRDPKRSAAFKVLKQSHAPAVLIELGYMSHHEDEKMLNSPEWQGKMAQSVTGAVDAFFARHTARAGSSR